MANQTLPFPKTAANEMQAQRARDSQTIAMGTDTGSDAADSVPARLAWITLIASSALILADKLSLTSHLCDWFSVNSSDEATHAFLDSVPLLMAAACFMTFITVTALRWTRLRRNEDTL